MNLETARHLLDRLACPEHSWTFGDIMFSPPVTSNQWAIVQCNRSPVGLVGFSALPYLAGHQPEHPWYHTNITTGDAFLDGKLLSASLETTTCRSQWFPDRVVRITEDQRLRLTNTTFCPWGEPAVVQRIELLNLEDSSREVTLGLSLRGCPGKLKSGELGKLYTTWDAPFEQGPETGSLIFNTGESCVLEGIAEDAELVQERIAQKKITLSPGETRTLHYIAVLQETSEAVTDVYVRVAEIAREDRLLEQHQAETPSRIAQALSGLPQLHTRDPDLQSLYDAGLRSIWVTRTEIPGGSYSPSYRAIGPQLCVNGVFLWDWAVGPETSVGGDLEVARNNLMQLLSDPPAHGSAKCMVYGVDIGAWYPANHWAIQRMAAAYTRRCGSVWLYETQNGVKVIDRLREHAHYWREYTGEDGLARHPDSDLLEVVCDYRGAVAGINANHAHGMLLFADLLELLNETDEAETVRMEARTLIQRIVEHLWDAEAETLLCLHEDGKKRPLFHAYDVITCLDLLGNELPAEMLQSIRRQSERLRTSYWMHACDPGDFEATWSPRVDHSAQGSYPAWPAMLAKFCVENGCTEADEQWIRGLAKTCALDPLGQAHFADTMVRTSGEGALKASSEHPYRNEWIAQSACAFGDLII